jgi:hypothetical protein
MGVNQPFGALEYVQNKCTTYAKKYYFWINTKAHDSEQTKEYKVMPNFVWTPEQGQNVNSFWIAYEKKLIM